MLPQICVRDGRGNPLLWLCGAKATIKIGNRQPGPKGHAQKKPQRQKKATSFETALIYNLLSENSRKVFRYHHHRQCETDYCQ